MFIYSTLICNTLELLFLCSVLNGRSCPGTIGQACTLPSVKCDPSMNFIISIDFSVSAFTGTLSSDIGRLQSLTYLNLSHTAISGSIPDTICALKGLQVLDLSNSPGLWSVPLCVVDAPLGGPLGSLSTKVLGSLVSAERGISFY